METERPQDDKYLQEPSMSHNSSSRDPKKLEYFKHTVREAEKMRSMSEKAQGNEGTTW